MASLLHRGALRVPHWEHLGGSGCGPVQHINQSYDRCRGPKWAGGGATAGSAEVGGGALGKEQSDWQEWSVQQGGAAAAGGHSASWDMIGDWCKVVEVGVVQEEGGSFPV